MKTAISVPNHVFAEAERLVKRLGIARSSLYTRALERYVAEVHGCDATGPLDRDCHRPTDVAANRQRSIRELWESEDPTQWRRALARYWEYVGPRNLEVETFMHHLDPRWVKGLGEQEWYDFLHDRYFPWKFTDCRWRQRNIGLLEGYRDRNRLGELLSIKEQLFAFNVADVREGLRIAEEVDGLGPPGASGLLAVLFPRHFGTCDQFVAGACAKVRSLAGPEISKMAERGDLRREDAVLLISIMRRKAAQLNALFGTDEWTPRKIDMILWASRE